MKRLIIAAVVLVLVVGSASGDLLDPEIYHNGEADMNLNVYVSETEDDTLMIRIYTEGIGDWSYTIREKSTMKAVTRGSGNAFGIDFNVASWKYPKPEEGKALHYEVTASFEPERGRTITHTANVMIRNSKGVINVVIR